MKRWMIRIILCLILGAITTVAVAWVCAIRAGILGHKSLPLTRLELTEAHQKLWDRWRPSGSGRHDAGDAVLEYEWFGCCQIALYAWTEFREEDYDWRDKPKPGTIQGEIAHVTRAGWPCKSAIAVHFMQESAGTWSINDAYGDLGEVIPSLWELNDTALVSVPVIPEWDGFLVNILFYVALWLGVFVGLARAKRLIRTKRGRCPRCGYDLRGGVISDKRLAISGEGTASIAGCPECGWNREEGKP